MGRHRLALLIVAVAIGVACAKREDAATASSESQLAPTTTPAAARTACAMLTAADMSTLLNRRMTSEALDEAFATTCTYEPEGDASMPHVSIKVTWGDGKVALASSGLLNRLVPDMKTVSNPLVGIGDQAAAIGPRYMVRTGEDLVEIEVFGVDEAPTLVRRAIDLMRPRMGPTSQASSNDGGASGGADDVAKTVEGLVGGLLAAQSERKPTGRDGSSSGATAGHPSELPSAPPTEETFSTFNGPPVRIPLVAKLTMVGAIHEPGRGDYEPLFVVRDVSPQGVLLRMTTDLPEGGRLQVDRRVRQEDLRAARRYRGWYEDSDEEVFEGTTAFSFSQATMQALAGGGTAPFELYASPANLLAALTNADADNYRGGVLARVEPRPLAVPVLVNDQPTLLPAVHLRGTLGNTTYDFYVLDDVENAILLRASGGMTARIVRITYPMPTADRTIEARLKDEARVELHGIYFDFGKDTLKPESTVVLDAIAGALTNNPSWSLDIEGHTDNIGGDAYNFDLSARRAAAVKTALVERYGIAATRLSTDGFGASRPKDSNDTLGGRARNRRVELVRK